MKHLIILISATISLGFSIGYAQSNFEVVPRVPKELTSEEKLEFTNWVSLGSGGLPHTLEGYRTLQRLNKNLRSPFSIDHFEHKIGGADDIQTLSELLRRSGERPKIAPFAVPHRQLDQHSSKSIRNREIAFFDSLAANHPQLLIKKSYFERHNNSIFVRDDKQLNQALSGITHGEIGHVHPSDGSIHMTLSPSDAKEVINKGWGELHGLSGQYINSKDRLSDTYTMVYAPRDEKELTVVKSIAEAAVRYSLHPNPAAQLPEVISVSNDYVWNGAVAAPNGRLFASMPCWLGPTPGVVEIMEDGSFKPYPGGEWNSWQRDRDPLKSFVDINSIFIDSNNHMWVNDAAAPDFGKAIAGAIKVVEIDLNTDKVVRTIVFDPKVVGSDTRLAHIRIWKNYAILAESKAGSFIIINLEDNSYRRILTGNEEYMLCQPGEVPIIEGRKMVHNDGRDMYIHNDLLEFRDDPDTLYFMTLFGKKLFRINAADLVNPNHTEQQIIDRIGTAYDFGGYWVAGMCRDKAGNLYLTDAENNGVRKLDTKNNLTTLINQKDIVWPIAPSIDKQGNLYFTASQLNRFPLLNDGKNTVEKPWKMWKLKVKQ